MNTSFAVDIFNPEKLGLITGSRCSPLFPKKSAEVGRETLAKGLASEKYWGYFDEKRDTSATEHGHFSEKYAMEYYLRHFDSKLERGGWRKKGECGGTTDAEASDYGVDFKCPTTLVKWQSYLFDGLDDDQINQGRWYMYLTGKSKWVMAIHLLETNWMSENGLVYPVPHDQRMILIDVLPDAEWLEKLQPAVDDVVSRREKYYNKLVAKFGAR